MAHPSPLAQHHARADALIADYAIEPRVDATGAGGGTPGSPSSAISVEVVQAYDHVELEYAALRKACVVLDQPQRAVLVVTGDDRLDFLDRMLTQRVRDLQPGQGRWSFWLNRKGRIDADVRVVALADRVLLETDTHAADRLRSTLSAYVITEDVSITDQTGELHRLSVHGPRGAEVLDAARARWNEPESIVVDRDDRAGVPGHELTMPVGRAVEVFESLLASGARPAGWHAFNIARIEAGTPLYYLDFGPDSLPHETGVVRERVDFRKGCYLGQEIVARMESRSGPKQVLVALDIAPRAHAEAGPHDADEQPDTGTPVWSVGTADSAEGAEGAAGAGAAPAVAGAPAGGAERAGVGVPAAGGVAGPVGGVTSSAISPMLGSIPVCFAVVRSAHAAAGTALAVGDGPDRAVPAVVRSSLRYLPADR